MNIIEWIGTHFIGLFQAGADQFMGYMTDIIPLLVVLLTFTNSLVAIIGEDRVYAAIRKGSKYTLFRYTVMPLLAVLLLTNPMAYTVGQYVEEKHKPAFYDAAVSLVHPVTGLFPYANGAELFVYLGIADGVTAAGYSQGSLAVRYLLVGVVIALLRGFVTEKITSYLEKRGAKSDEEVANA